MRVYEGKQWEFVTLLSIVDLGGSARPKDVKNNIEEKEYIYFLPSDLRAMNSVGHENEIWWRNRVDWTRNNLADAYCIDKSIKGIWTITEKGRRYLRELCFFALDIVFHRNSDDPDIDFFLYGNAFERAKGILDGQQRESELSEDFAGLKDEESSERVVTYIRRYRKVVDDLKEKYRNRCQVEGCGFTFRKRSGYFYSEGHHLIPLSKGGKQEKSNVVVLCPNHHRMFHYADVEMGKLQCEKRDVRINGELYFLVY